MIRRCHYPKDKRYKNYGGRGIRVCKKWREDFHSFLKWALSTGYLPHLSIERKDNNKGYSPSNCCWATAKEQARNKRTNKVLSAFGKSMCVAAWAEHSSCVVTEDQLRRRLSKGMPLEKALTMPIKGKTSTRKK